MPQTRSLNVLPLALQQQGQGYPILCLHGHPGSANCMKVFTDVLSQQLWTISPDLRGYGESKAQSPFTMESHLLDLKALLDRLKIERCLVLGWSLGGILAMELALQLPERIAGLILVATSAHPVGNVPRPTAAELLNTLAVAGLHWMRPSSQWSINTFGRQSLLRHLVSQHNEETYRFLMSTGFEAVLGTSRYAHQALSKALSNRYDRRADLEAIEQPCLVLSGANDRHILKGSTDETAQRLKNSRYICYPDVAHLFPWEIPQIVSQDIRQWIEAFLM